MRGEAERDRLRRVGCNRPRTGWVSWPHGLRRRVGCLAICAVALLASFPAHSTVIVAKSFDDLTAEADLIFVGTVTGLQSRWVDEEQSAIETVVTFSVEEALLGDLGKEESLRFSGGEVDGLREQIAGVPRFVVGQRVVLFARRGHSASPVVGFHQGCFRVVDGAAAAVVQGCSVMSNVPTAAADTAALRTGTTRGSRAEAETLQDFLARTRRGIEQRPVVP